MDAKYCDMCGAKVLSGVRFCRNCGHDLLSPVQELDNPSDKLISVPQPTVLNVVKEKLPVPEEPPKSELVSTDLDGIKVEQVIAKQEISAGLKLFRLALYGLTVVLMLFFLLFIVGFTDGDFSQPESALMCVFGALGCLLLLLTEIMSSKSRSAKNLTPTEEQRKDFKKLVKRIRNIVYALFGIGFLCMIADPYNYTTEPLVNAMPIIGILIAFILQWVDGLHHKQA